MIAVDEKTVLAGEERRSIVRLDGKRSIRERAALLIERIIFYSLLSLIPLVALPYGTVEPWWEALFETIVFALGALWIVEGFLRGHWLMKEHKVFLLLLLLALYAFLQTLPLLPGEANTQGLKAWNAISADPFETWLSVLKLLSLILAGVLLVRYTRSTNRLRALLYTIIFVGVLSAIFGILRQTTQHSDGFILPFLKQGSGFGQFINKNHFAYLMEMALGLTLGLVVARGARREHALIYLALALPLWTALVLSNSRGGILSMLAQVLFLAILFSFTGAKKQERERAADGSMLGRLARTSLARSLLILCLVATVFLGAVWTGGEALTSRLETVRSEMAADAGAETSRVGRKDIWKATWKMIKDHPLVGVGFNGYWVAIPTYHQASGESTPQQAHNDYLELLASGGVIGCLLVVWFLFLFTKAVRRGLQAKDSFNRACILAACAGLFAVAVHSAVDFGLHITINALVFTALVAVAASGGISGEESGADA